MTWMIRRAALILLTVTIMTVAAALARSSTEAQTATRTFSGSFAGSGTFSNSLCAWQTTYTGTVALTLTFGGPGVTGTARHRGSDQDALASGPPECGGDVSTLTRRSR